MWKTIIVILEYNLNNFIPHITILQYDTMIIGVFFLVIAIGLKFIKVKVHFAIPSVHYICGLEFGGGINLVKVKKW
jgi:hypothetical protein